MNHYSMHTKVSTEQREGSVLQEDAVRNLPRERTNHGQVYLRKKLKIDHANGSKYNTNFPDGV